MKARGHLYFGTFLVLIAGYAIWTASGWSFKAGFFPLAVAIPLLALTLLHLYLERFGAADTARGPAVETEFADEVPPEVARRRALVIFSWIALFILLVYLLGFPLAVPIFVFAYLKMQSAVSWLNATLLTSLTWGLFHGLFQRVVRLQFDTGVIQLWLGL